MLYALVSTAFLAAVSAQRTTYLLDVDFKYQNAAAAPPTCPNPNTTFPIVMDNKQCMGLNQQSASSLEECIDSCCADDQCATCALSRAGRFTPRGVV